MNDRAVDAANLAANAGDLSLWGLFAQADIVVKLVMILLVFASVWVWAIVFEKWQSLRRANRAADVFEDKFWSGGSLDALYDQDGAKPTHPMAAVFGAAMGEWCAACASPAPMCPAPPSIPASIARLG